MKVDNLGLFTLEDILADFPDEKKTMEYLRSKYDDGCCLAFISATYSKKNDKRERYAILMTGNKRDGCNIYSPKVTVHIDSYKKNNIWRIQIRETLATSDPRYTIGDAKDAYIMMKDSEDFLLHVYQVANNYYKNATIDHEGILWTFTMDPAEVERTVIDHSPIDEEELPF